MCWSHGQHDSQAQAEIDAYIIMMLIPCTHTMPTIPMVKMEAEAKAGRFDFASIERNMIRFQEEPDLVPATALHPRLVKAISAS